MWGIWLRGGIGAEPMKVEPPRVERSKDINMALSEEVETQQPVITKLTTQEFDAERLKIWNARKGNAKADYDRTLKAADTKQAVAPERAVTHMASRPATVRNRFSALADEESDTVAGIRSTNAEGRRDVEVINAVDSDG